MAKKNNSKQAKAKNVSEVDNVTKLSGKVIVYLNHPQGIVFDLPKSKVTINGSNENLRGKPMGILDTGKFGRTVIDKDDWAYIKENYSSMAIFKNGLIFVAEDEAKGNSEAEEKKDIKTGTEPVNPEAVDVIEDKKED